MTTRERRRNIFNRLPWRQATTEDGITTVPITGSARSDFFDHVWSGDTRDSLRERGWSVYQEGRVWYLRLPENYTPTDDELPRTEGEKEMIGLLRLIPNRIEGEDTVTFRIPATMRDTFSQIPKLVDSRIAHSPYSDELWYEVPRYHLTDDLETPEFAHYESDGETVTFTNVDLTIRGESYSGYDWRLVLSSISLLGRLHGEVKVNEDAKTVYLHSGGESHTLPDTMLRRSKGAVPLNPAESVSISRVRDHEHDVLITPREAFFAPGNNTQLAYKVYRRNNDLHQLKLEGDIEVSVDLLTGAYTNQWLIDALLATGYKFTASEGTISPIREFLKYVTALPMDTGGRLVEDVGAFLLPPVKDS